ncbi:MAG: DUF1553 domain-containing protein [Gemmataceae bacterium]
MQTLRVPGFVTGLLIVLAPAWTWGADSAGVSFFEQKIRPVLIKECYSCHSAEGKQRGGLVLDSKMGLLEGGDTGPAIVPGKPAESLLIQALRNDGLSMPPKGQLPEAVIADFERWIEMGAPDPRDGKTVTAQSTIDIDKGRQFWSFQKLREHPVPAVQDTAWPFSDIDRFILAPLEAKGVRPAVDAEASTLLRRLYIDLIGLPPAPEEVAAFEKAAAQDRTTAIAEVVDRLLASPHFGERWGRHWLDLARYADSNGKDENFVFHEAFRYRDYVIRSFNNDKPIDRFFMEQIAGDLMPAATQEQRDEQLTGTGFLVIGPKVLADRDFKKRHLDVIDEQIDTTGRVFLGMTLGCARCHDHKFDPIPTTDYYALAGIFLSTRTLQGTMGNPVITGWVTRPLGADGEERLKAVANHKKQLAAIAAQIKKVQGDLKAFEDMATMRVPTQLVGITVDDNQAEKIGAWKASVYSRPYVGAGYIHDDKMNKGEKAVIFTPNLPGAGEYEVFISYTAGSGRSTNTPVTIQFAGGDKTVLVNQEVKPKLDGMFHSVGKYRFEAGSKGSVTISNKGTTGYVIVDAVRFVPVGELDGVAEREMGVPETVKNQIVATQAQLRQLEAEEKKMKANAPEPPAMVLAVRDEDQITNCPIYIRGNPHASGDEVPRGFLSVASAGPTPTIPAKHSGRLELAQWIASSDNPLTARVYVNRVWQHLLGEGIVRTVDNFGIQGERPTHPELLDELAWRFVQEGWSTKKLIRAIVLSRVYQLNSQPDVSARKLDPENKLFSHANRRRVEVEVLRDSILTVSGRLDRTLFGSSVAHLGERALDNSSKGGVDVEDFVRRGVYLPVIRNELPPILEVFDFADPDVATGKRDVTTASTQALYLMNSPFVLKQSQLAAQRLVDLSSDDNVRMRDLYLRALGRTPTVNEKEAILAYLSHQRQTQAPNAKINLDVAAWSGVCLAMFGSSEFRFIE